MGRPLRRLLKLSTRPCDQVSLNDTLRLAPSRCGVLGVQHIYTMENSPLSDRSLSILNSTCLLFVCGLAFPFGYFGEWAIVLVWLVSFYLWIVSLCEIDKRTLHSNSNA